MNMFFPVHSVCHSSTMEFLGKQEKHEVIFSVHKNLLLFIFLMY